MKICAPSESRAQNAFGFGGESAVRATSYAHASAGSGRVWHIGRHQLGLAEVHHGVLNGPLPAGPCHWLAGLLLAPHRHRDVPARDAVRRNAALPRNCRRSSESIESTSQKCLRQPPCYHPGHTKSRSLRRQPCAPRCCSSLPAIGAEPFPRATPESVGLKLRKAQRSFGSTAPVRRREEKSPAALRQ